MKRFLLAFCCFFLVVHNGESSTAVAVSEVPWTTSLSHDGGGVWRHRRSFAYQNNSKEPLAGRPVTFRVEDDANPAPKVRELRVTDEKGREVLFAVFDPDGRQKFDGELSSRDRVVLPVDCEPEGFASYFLYSGNPRAELVPDWLDAKPGLLNGDMEAGEGEIPDGWEATASEPGRRRSRAAAGDDFRPKSGEKALKVEIESGRTPSWFAVRQHAIPLACGGKYRFSAFVRGENVVGNAGWFLHAGSLEKPQAVNIVRKGGDGDFDWTEVVIEFTAPGDADRATVGTVLYGTGTAWYDDARLVRLDEDASGVSFTTPGPLESIAEHYTVIEAHGDWPEIANGDYLCRSTFRVVNDSENDLNEVPVLMTLRGTPAHGLAGIVTDLEIRDAGRTIPVTMVDEENFRLSARLDIPARTIKYFHVYYRFDETGISDEKPGKRAVAAESGTAHPELQAASDPADDLPNLLQNGGFESEPEENGFPVAWRRNGPSGAGGIRYSLEADPKIVRFGRRCAKFEVAEDAGQGWFGWTQRVAVEPGRSYLVQGRLKTAGKEASARIHLHFHDEKGGFTQDGAMTSVGPDVSGNSDWTRLAEIVTAPPEARFMTVHLTSNTPGTFWHDNVTVVDGLFAEQTGRESTWSFDRDPTPFAWQVPVVAKVFPQTIPPRSYRELDEPLDPFFTLQAARNEKEPLQIALRTGNPRQVRVEVFTPANAQGRELTDFEIHRVGYVPVDYPSSYYNTTIPRWYRKTPTSAPGCDGWPGLWPDPLLPGNTVRLEKDRTESFWITWSIPKDAPPGKYSGGISVSYDWGDAIPAHRKRHYPSSRMFPLEIIVRDFTLPEETNFSAIYDVRTGPGGAKYWGKPEEDVYPEIVEKMTANRLSPDKILPELSVEFKDGRFMFDWTKFDETARYLFEEKKIPRLYTPHLFYLFGWGHPPKDFFGEKPYQGDWPFADADFSKLRPEYKAKYQACLREFWTHVREKGWADRFVLYISDEPNYWTKNVIAQMIALCGMIHEVDPAIPIYSSTWRYVPEWKDSLDVWGIAHYGLVPVETMEQIRRDGSRIWFTTDGMLCLDTPYCAIERLLPYYCWKYGAEAYEFWGVGWLTYNPYERGNHAYIHQTSTPGEYYWVRYPNGDGYLLYPGGPIASEGIVSSIRFEQAREGVEDFEYFRLLSQLVEKAKKAGKDASQGEAALEAVKEIVGSPSQIGRYSSKILPNPRRLDELRRRVADAIEALSD